MFSKSRVEADPGGRPGGAVLQRHHQARRLGDAHRRELRSSEIIGPYDPDAIRELKDEVRDPLHERQRHAGPGPDRSDSRAR